jgi:hypothetical protein
VLADDDPPAAAIDAAEQSSDELLFLKVVELKLDDVWMNLISLDGAEAGMPLLPADRIDEPVGAGGGGQPTPRGRQRVQLHPSCGGSGRVVAVQVGCRIVVGVDAADGIDQPVGTDGRG